MIKKDIISLTIEYYDGSIVSYEEEGMYHVSRRDFKRGATKAEDGFISHQIQWKENSNAGS